MILPHAHVSASELKETFILVVESKHKTPKTAPALFFSYENALCCNDITKKCNVISCYFLNSKQFMTMFNAIFN